MIRKIKLQIILFFLSLLISFLLFHLNYISFQRFFSLALGIAIPFINFLIFYFLYFFSYNKSNKTFLIYNIGGMALRLILLLASLFWVLKYLKIDVYGFIFVFFLYYILLLVSEIIIVKNQIDNHVKSVKNAKNVDF